MHVFPLTPFALLPLTQDRLTGCISSGSVSNKGLADDQGPPPSPNRIQFKAFLPVLFPTSYYASLMGIVL